MTEPSVEMDVLDLVQEIRDEISVSGRRDHPDPASRWFTIHIAIAQIDKILAAAEAWARRDARKDQGWPMTEPSVETAVGRAAIRAAWPNMPGFLSSALTALDARDATIAEQAARIAELEERSYRQQETIHDRDERILALDAQLAEARAAAERVAHITGRLRNRDVTALVASQLLDEAIRALRDPGE